MPRGIDQVKLINLTVLRFVAQRRRLRLDGNAAFALKIHAVEDLLAHFAVGEAAAALNQADESMAGGLNGRVLRDSR